MPKFNFVDPDAVEWRIRPGTWKGFRWQIEQRTDTGWLRRAWAPTRKLAQSRMEAFWVRVVSSDQLGSAMRESVNKPERVELTPGEQSLIIEHARQARLVPDNVSERVLAAHGRRIEECEIYYHHLGIGRNVAYLMCRPRRG